MNVLKSYFKLPLITRVGGSVFLPFMVLANMGLEDGQIAAKKNDLIEKKLLKTDHIDEVTL